MKRKMRRARFIAVPFILLLAVGCGDRGILPWGKDQSPDMTAGQAGRRFDYLLAGTFAAIKPTLKWRDGSTEVLQSTDSFSNKTNGEAVVSRTRYVRTRIAKSRISGLMGDVERYWKKSGYRISSVNPKIPTFVGSTTEGFSLRVSVGAQGNVYFDIASPEVKDPGYSGEMPGEAGSDFPVNSKGMPDIMPDVDDSFWSH